MDELKLNPHQFLSNASELEKLVFHGTVGMGIYEAIILFLILFLMMASGRICNILCGDISSPKHHPMATQVKHPGWSPKLRNIRSYFRYFYLIQAPAIWLIWLQMRWEQLPSSSPQSPFEPVSQLFNDEELPEQLIPIELLVDAKVRRDSYFPFLDDFAPIWTQLVQYLIPGVSPFFSSTQLALFLFQFYLGLSWPVFFFRYKRIGASALISLGVWFALNFTIRSFWAKSSTAAILLYSYLAWITTATALSITIWFINLKKKQDKKDECQTKDDKLEGKSSANTPPVSPKSSSTSSTPSTSPKVGDGNLMKRRRKAIVCPDESDEEEEDHNTIRRNPLHRIRHYFNGGYV